MFFLFRLIRFAQQQKKQLQVLAEGLDIECFDSDLSLGPDKIALDALAYAKEKNKDIVIVDTAGRLHVDDELMSQLETVKKAIEGQDPEVLLVADAMTGQESVKVPKHSTLLSV